MSSAATSAFHIENFWGRIVSKSIRRIPSLRILLRECSLDTRLLGLLSSKLKRLRLGNCSRGRLIREKTSVVTQLGNCLGGPAAVCGPPSSRTVLGQPSEAAYAATPPN